MSLVLLRDGGEAIEANPDVERNASCKKCGGRRRGVGGVVEKQGEEGIEKKAGSRRSKKEKKWRNIKVKRDVEVGKLVFFTFFSFSMPYEIFTSINKQWQV